MEYEKESPYTMEPSFTFSSINGGSRFIGVALTARLESWLQVGVEGEMPADFDEKAQIYSTRLLARIPLLNNENKIFLQGSFSYSFFNITSDTNVYAADAFFNSEFLVGYKRKVTKDWALGAMLGAQYSTIDNYIFGTASNDIVFYNRASLMASYIF